MKSVRRTILLVLGFMLLVLGCGEADSSEAQESSDETIAVETDPDLTEPETVTEQVPLPLYPEGTLNPAEVTADVPVSAKALFGSFYAWNGKQVTLTGYCYIPYMRDTITVVDDLELIGDIDSSERLASIVFGETPDESIRKDQLISVTGTVEYSWTGDLILVDAILHPEALPAEEGFETSPYIYDGTTPISVSEFAEMFTAWIGKEVTVEGYYHSTTTSTTSYGTTIRVDIGDPEDIYTKYVGCEMNTEPPETLVDDRYGVQIRGTIVGESFDMVDLEECDFVNR